jgi:hypothetical protein
MNIRRKLIVSTFLSMCAACAETTALKNFTLIDGAAAQPQPNSALLIVDGCIHWIGSASNLHGHVGNTVDLAQDPKNFTTENVERQLRMYASYGVTSVVSMGSEQPLIADMRAGQRGANRPTMARIFTARRGFIVVGGYHLEVAAHVFYLDDAKALIDAGLSGPAHSVRDKPVDDALIRMMAPTFVFDAPNPMLDDPFFASSVSASVLRTLKDPEFQKRVAAEPDDTQTVGDGTDG